MGLGLGLRLACVLGLRVEDLEPPKKCKLEAQGLGA